MKSLMLLEYFKEKASSYSVKLRQYYLNIWQLLVSYLHIFIPKHELNSRISENYWCFVV